MREIEVKLPVNNVPAIRRRLRSLGFQPVTPRLFERNVLYDTPTLSLRQSAQLLRLRSKGRRWWLTFKARPTVPSRHKIREEIEIETPQGPELGAILERLGFRPSFEYQKYRTEYQRPASRGLILVDETPVGNYLELEGQPRWIDRTAAELGYRTGDYILESYGILYLAWCQKKRIEPSNMVFAEKKGLLPPKL